MKISNLIEIGDERGKLIALEENKEVPFDIKRVFYIYNTANLPRGQHAHHETRQYLIAINGSCKVTLDDGTKKKTFLLDNKTKGLFQDKMVWGTMHDFSDDCILFVLANDFYKAEDYITNYNDFMKAVKMKAVENDK